MKKKVIVTAKGAALKCNHWSEGEVIECHENVANHFIEIGFAAEIGTESAPLKETLKPKKSK